MHRDGAARLGRILVRGGIETPYIERPGSADSIIVNGGSAARFIATGYLLYVQSGILFAARFDSSRPAPVAGAVPVVEGVLQLFELFWSFADQVVRLAEITELRADAVQGQRPVWVPVTEAPHFKYGCRHTSTARLILRPIGPKTPRTISNISPHVSRRGASKCNRSSKDRESIAR